MRTSQNQQKRHSISKHIECSFLLIAKVEEENEMKSWNLKIMNSKHNHIPSSTPEAHSVLKRLAMTSEIRSEITRQLTIQTAFSKIFAVMRIDDSTATNSMFIVRNVYNFQIQLRRDELKSLTLIQALIRKFERKNWIYEFQKNEKNRIINFFFIRDICQQILKSNFEVLVMNCIYKINRFKMPLLVISDQTTLHTSFYVTFCFQMKERTENYIFAMQQMKSLYLQLELPMPTVIVTDMERDKSSASKFSLRIANHLLKTDKRDQFHVLRLFNSPLTVSLAH